MPVEQYRAQQIPDPDNESHLSTRQLVWEVITTLIPAVLIALFINVYIAEAAEIEAGPSMQPNLFAGYRIMTEKISYHLHEPQRGDIVVIERPEDEGNLIKRVVGLAGETIEIRAGHTYVNGEAIDEPWVTYFGGRDIPAMVIPDGHIYIMGDNRPNSRDSRDIGPVPIESIIGKGWFVYWPLGEFRFLIPMEP
jgi:signal peptidase I